MSRHILKKTEEKLRGLDAQALLIESFRLFPHDRIVIASSQSIEDQVLTHMACTSGFAPRIFTLDTGRLFPETYETMERTMSRYNFRYEFYTPNAADLETMLAVQGPELFFRSQEARHECCRIRKTDPLNRVLSSADAWICGLRREQAITRSAVAPVEYDQAHDMIKINPLWDWSEQQVSDFIHQHDIPYNPLQDRGFRSIGCQPCTRAIGREDDLRAGRWWWEDPQHRECGLHCNAGKS